MMPNVFIHSEIVRRTGITVSHHIIHTILSAIETRLSSSVDEKLHTVLLMGLSLDKAGLGNYALIVMAETAVLTYAVHVISDPDTGEIEIRLEVTGRVETPAGLVL